MHLPLSIRKCTSRQYLTSICLLAAFQACLAIYCGDDDCYDLLGVAQTASSSEIKKAYYALSLKYHPDKNSDPDAPKTFTRIANAYEILSDEEQRKEYDYAIAHPEQVYYNYAQYYHRTLLPKADLRLVVGGIVTVVSLLQFCYRWSSYEQAMRLVRQTPAYRNRLKQQQQLQLQKQQQQQQQQKGSLRKRGSKRASSGQDADTPPVAAAAAVAEPEVVLAGGAARPLVWDIFALQLLLLPYTVAKQLLWVARWIARYHILGKRYTLEDASFLTRWRLGIPSACWDVFDKELQLKLVGKQLWIKSNWQQFQLEARQNVRRR